VWSHHAAQRRSTATAAKDDVGLHLPTAASLSPVLALANSPEATGRALFDAFESTLPHPPRDVVAFVRMDVGFWANHIDEGKVLRAILHDSNVPGIDTGLAAIECVTLNTNSRQLVWGLTSHEAVAILNGKSFQVPTKDGTQTFTMRADNALDGFFVELVGLDVDRAAKAHLWDVLFAAGATPIAGIYTNTSLTTGAHGSRYRLSFKNTSVPPIFTAQNRLIDEVIFLGKVYKIYGKGYYSHRKQLQRMDLDILAREHKIPLPGSKSAASKQTSRATGQAKRQRVTPDDEPEVAWTVVHKGASIDAAGSPRPWTSVNFYSALHDQVDVSTKTLHSADGTDVQVVPVCTQRPDVGAVPKGQYTDGTKLRRHRLVRAEMDLDAVLDEIAQADAAAAAAAASFELDCQLAQSKTPLDLPKYIAAGEADWVQRDLYDHPTVFRRQLRSLAKDNPLLLEPLTRLVVMNKWLRGSNTATAPFFQLYKDYFGHSFSLASLAGDCLALAQSGVLHESLSTDDSFDGNVSALDLEPILALAELCLGSTAPLFYQYDGAISHITDRPVFAIAGRFGHRYLSSATLCAVLWGNTTLGMTVWQAVEDLIRTAHDSVTTALLTCDATSQPELLAAVNMYSYWLGTMQTLAELGDHAVLGVHPPQQVLLDWSSRQLVHGDLLDLWSDPEAPGAPAPVTHVTDLNPDAASAPAAALRC